MRKINKTTEPTELTEWKKRNPKSNSYKDLGDTEICALHKACSKEQYYLCAYCCDRIILDTVTNDHIIPQSIFPNLSMDYNNIVACCKTCNNNKGATKISLTPLMPECETELRFNYDGRVQGLKDRAKQLISALKWEDLKRNDYKKLQGKRKQAIQHILETEGYGLDTMDSEKETMQILLDDLLNTNVEKMQPFAPVLVNILQNDLKQLQ